MNVALLRRTGEHPRERARAVFDAIGPLIDDLRTQGALAAWYFMRKPPDLRLRLAVPARDGEQLAASISETLQPLVGDAIERCFLSVYEPETTRFGGEEGMSAAHDYFTADSELWLALDRLERRGERRLAPERFCTAVLDDLFCRALRDGAEVFDTWTNLTRLAPPPRDVTLPPVRRQALQSLLVEAGDDERAIIERYAAANTALAERLAQIWGAGQLGTGPRAWLATLGSFNLHRHGLSGADYAPWVAAMATIWDPRAALVGADATVDKEPA